MKVLFTWIAALLLLISLVSANAQVPSCRVRHFDNTNGLPQNTITGLAFDKHHFLWIGTNGGLVKYDGSSLENISDGQIGSRIKMLINTNSGEVLATDDKLNSLVSTEGKYQILLNNKKDSSKNQLFESQNLFGKKFILADAHKIIRNNMGYATVLSWSSSKDVAFVWNRLYQTGLMIADSAMVISGILPLQHGFIGNVFLGVNNRNEIVSYSGKHYLGLISKIVATDRIINVADFTKNAVWVQSVGKLYAIYRGTFFSMYLKNNIISLSPIFSALPNFNEISFAKFQEASSTLAIGTSSNGLYIATPAIARTVLIQDNKQLKFKHAKYDNVTALLWTAKGQLLADNGFLYGNTVSTWIHPDSIMPNYLSQDDGGKIWIKTRRGQLVVLNDDFTVFKKLNGGWGGGGCIQTDRHTYWLHNLESVSRVSYDSAKATYLLDYTLPLKINGGGNIHHMYKANEQHFLLCTTHGLYKFNWRTRQLTHIKSSYKFDFRCIAKSPGGQIYATTYGNGSFLFRGDSLVSIPSDRNKYLNYPHAFVFDSNGYVWIPTNNGLFQVRETDMLEYVNGKSGKFYQHHYDYTNGFATNEFNGGGFQSGLLAPDGNIYLSSMKGLVILNPYQVKPDLPKYPLYIKQVSVDKEKIENWKNIVLPKGFKNFKIKIQTPFYGSANNLNISYRIKGFNESWTHLENNTEVDIETLPAGTYEIGFRKRNGFGKNNYAYTTLPFKVESYFYETKRFYIILIFGTFLAFYSFTKYRTFALLKNTKKLEEVVQSRTIALHENNNELQNKNEELLAKTEMLDTVYSVVTHDLISPLKFLRRSATRLDENFEGMQKSEIKDHLQSILHTTKHTKAFVKDLLAWIKLKQTSDLRDKAQTTPYLLIDKNIQLFLWLANERGVQLIQHPPYDNTPITLSSELTQILIRNCIDNALKYTYQGSVTLQAFVQETSLHIYITDTGLGMDSNTTAQINAYNTPYLVTIEQYMGMKIIFDVLRVLNGVLFVQSELGQGTKVHITIPINRGIA